MNASASLQEISERVSLSATPCWRRILRLEREGFIRQRVALLDRDKLNVGVTVFVGIRTSQHNEKWFKRFSAVVAAIPQIVEFYRMTGDVHDARTAHLCTVSPICEFVKISYKFEHSLAQQAFKLDTTVELS